MRPHEEKHVAQVDYGGPIEMQDGKRCASCRRKSNEMRVFLIPRKMVTPLVLTRVIQRRHLFAYRIVTFAFVVLMPVATGTRERQIIQRRSAPLRCGNDVFDRKGIGRNIQWTQAIFTAPQSASLNHMAQPL